MINTVTDIRKHVGYFTVDPYLRLGDTDSAHGVQFGELADVGQVAIKPFAAEYPVGYRRAQGEMRSLQKVEQAGFQALEPIRVAQGGLAAYLITSRRKDLRHLGQMNWSVNVAERELAQVVVPTLGRAAVTLSEWHNKGIFHGDAQAKNVVFDHAGASVYVDAEGTHFNPDKQERAGFMRKDVGKLGLSVLNRNLLYDKSTSYKVGFLAENLLDPYYQLASGGAANIDPTQEKQVIQDHWIQALTIGRPIKWTDAVTVAH